MAASGAMGSGEGPNGQLTVAAIQDIANRTGVAPEFVTLILSGFQAASAKGMAIVAATKGNGSGGSPALKGDPYNPDSVGARVKPPYVANPAHDPSSSLFNPSKTPEPADAQTVYANAVRGNSSTWYGVGADGSIYRYFGDNAGGVHFSGTVSKNDVPNDALKQLGIKK